MEKIEYQNEFGYLRFAPVTKFMEVSSISSEMDEVKVHKFDITTAEQISLITENRGIQIGIVTSDFCYLTQHQGSSTARVCRIDHLVFNSDEEPAEIISRLNRGQNEPL